MENSREIQLQKEKQKEKEKQILDIIIVLGREFLCDDCQL